ncbi:MAG TPA: class I SAM-dependent methyltransferase [Bellilinea sp.]|nr:class I SAM-dependent methyltransferase [Bellilinea sp.]
MIKDEPRYIPALNQNWLTPLYDPALRYVMREDRFKQQVVAQADPQPGERILDLGCGTGTLTIMLQLRQPEAIVTGLDGDEKVLGIAQQKAQRAGADAIRWEEGLADQLPYPAASFDKVVSSMVIHHLTLAEKLGAFQQVFRVLRPGGSFHIADFGLPHDRLMRFVASYMRFMERTTDNFEGKLPDLLSQAGFTAVEEIGHMRSFFGPLSLYRAEKRN